MLNIAGVDEVGRGPLAGPVFAACVLLTGSFPELDAVQDSKKLSAKKRALLDVAIRKHTIWALGAASVEEIDRLNILQATYLAMRRAVDRMPVKPDALLIDGNKVPPFLSVPARAIIGGDASEPSIACASIIAKVARDRVMEKLDARYTGYGWASNAGYGTAIHLRALHDKGITAHHRLSFAPVKAAV